MRARRHLNQQRLASMFRNFFYIDTDWLRMAFTQLPDREKMAFKHKFRLDFEVELSLTPNITAKKDRPELPEDTSVALVLLIEKYLRKKAKLGNPENLTGEFIEGDFCVRYKRIPGRGDDIFFALPTYGSWELNDNYCGVFGG